MLSKLNETRFLIIGEVMTDVHLNVIDKSNSVVELGGVFHAARALHAINAIYSIAYFAPSYLFSSIEKYGNILRSERNYCFGTIDGSPNVMVVSESAECGPQGYIDILKDQADIMYQDIDIKKVIDDFKPSDILLFPGKYNISKLLSELNNCEARIHIDFHYNSQNIIDGLCSSKFQHQIDTAILSTSSELFKIDCKASFHETINYFNRVNTKTVLLKENRGGSRLYICNENKLIKTPAYLGRTLHSVGVGDCFNSIFLHEYYRGNEAEIALVKASFGASLYASTFKHDEFVNLINAYLSLDNEIIYSMQGVAIPWEMRKDIHIYIAAPDFPDIDCTHIDILSDCLNYHNFTAHLPVRENRIIVGDESIEVQDAAFEKDLRLIEKSALLIAVLLYDDPGTLLELGMFAAKGKPTILYDPYNKARNLFLRKLPTKWCKNLNEVIDSVFELLNAKG
jgi:nucleoside 2-deoxyribosyltransferase